MQKNIKKNNKKVGILTYHFSHNCGAVLQALALMKTVDKYVDCTIIDYQPDYHASWDDYRYKYECPPNAIKRIWNNNNNKIRAIASIAYNMPSILTDSTYHKDRKRTKEFEKFVNKNMKLSKRCKTLKDIELLSKDYDVLISGSDQVWNTGIVGNDYDDAYFLNINNDNIKRYSYAASAGNSWNKDNIGVIAHKLSNFDCISIRESDLKDVLEQKGINCRLDIDPSLLLEQEDYYEYEEEIDVPSNYVFIYAFHISDELVSTIKQLKEKLNCDFISCSFNRELSKKVGFEIREIEPLVPGTFLYLVHHSKYVVTSTYHGLVFATIYRKPFICLPPEHGKSRIDSFLSMFNLQDYYWCGYDVMMHTEYNSFNNIIKEMKNRSLSYIQMICDKRHDCY